MDTKMMDVRGLKNWTVFFKNSWSSKIGPIIAKLFFYFFITWFDSRFRKSFQVIGTKFIQCETLFFLSFATYAFCIKNKFLFILTSVGLHVGWVFGQILYLQDFFLNGLLNFETSDSDFRYLLDEVFNIAVTYFFR